MFQYQQISPFFEPTQFYNKINSLSKMFQQIKENLSQQNNSISVI